MWLVEVGRGGDGGHSPQYVARLMILEEILGRSITMYVSSSGIDSAETSSAMIAQINERLLHDQHDWRVRVTAGCFEFYEV